MSTEKPFHLFGGKSKKGGMADYVASTTSQDEALSLALQLGWWELVLANDAGLAVVKSSADEKKRGDTPNAA